MAKARSWSKIRADATAAGLIDERDVDAARTQLHDVVRAQRLADIRRGQAVTQVGLSKSMNISQARVSKIENGDLSHTELGTLESYVEALGGRLHIVADFGDSTIEVH